MGLVNKLIKKIKGNLIRKERRKVSTLSKKLSLALACLLSFNLLPINSIKVSAEELVHKVTVNGMSPEEYNEIYIKYLNGELSEERATGNSGLGIQLISGIIAPPITIDGEVAYCLNLYKNFPVGNNYPSGNPYENTKIRAVLYHGYPVNASGLQKKYGISDSEARYYTQVAVWQMTGDLTSRDYGIGYVDELLSLGRSGSLPSSNFNISSNNLEATQMNGYQETEVITTSGSNGTFTFPSDSDVWSVDLNGNKKNTFTVGESFKIRATKGYNEDKRIRIKTSLNKPAALKYDGSGGFQDIVKYYSDPINDFANIRVKFNGTGKIELFKTDDLGNVLPGVKFGLYSDAAATNKVAEAVTGADGKLVFDNVIAGEYWTKELETLPSHVLNPEIKKVVVNGGDTQRVDYTNEIIKGRIQITKVDEETGE
ncbi:Cys-Gln thioester bond-forming surface protein, partial [Clostridium sp. DSM 100503]|uniref:Cys-Gln thioester bond-forming surface protein n=1 Tax=Clostridium sp. DSM 100503 TaxID=2963282 RepID=UPI00214A5A71